MSVSATAERTPRVWWTATLAGMASYLDAAALTTVGLVIVLFKDPLRLSTWAIGIISSLMTVFFAAGSLVGGRLGDRFGRRRVFTVSLLVYALGALLMMLAMGQALLFAGVVLIGFACGADLPVVLALAAEAAPEKDRGKVVQFTTVLWLVGIAMTLILSTIVAPHGEVGGRVLLGHLFVVAVLVAILRRTLPESREWTNARARKEKIVVSAGATIDKGAVKELLRPPLISSLIAITLFYAGWNIAANLVVQYGSYFFVEVAHSTVQFFSKVSLMQLPIGIVMGLVFMRVVDTKYRMTAFGTGAIISIIAWAIPTFGGFRIPFLVAMMIGLGLGAPLSGEGIYKVWSQELFPTLLRATTQGLSIAITRALTALVALFTPAALAASAKGFFIAMFTLQVMAMVIGYFWIPRRPVFGRGDTVHEGHEATTNAIMPVRRTGNDVDRTTTEPSQPSTEEFDG